MPLSGNPVSTRRPPAGLEARRRRGPPAVRRLNPICGNLGRGRNVYGVTSCTAGGWQRAEKIERRTGERTRKLGSLATQRGKKQG